MWKQHGAAVTIDLTQGVTLLHYITKSQSPLVLERMLQEPLILTSIDCLTNVITMITSQPNLDVDLFHYLVGLINSKYLTSTFFAMMEYPVKQQSITLVDQYVTLIEPLLNEEVGKAHKLVAFHHSLFMYCCQKVNH